MIAISFEDSKKAERAETKEQVKKHLSSIYRSGKENRAPLAPHTHGASNAVPNRRTTPRPPLGSLSTHN